MLPLIIACATAPALPPLAAPAPPTPPPVTSASPADAAGSLDPDSVPHGLYRSAAEGGLAYDRLRHLTDNIGHRLVGSPALAEAERWAAAELAADGFTVRLEPVETKHWVRGDASVQLLSPKLSSAERSLPVLALGGSVPTPKGGIEADVVAVPSLDALDELPDDAVRGRIVLFDQPFTGYGATVQARLKGADHAAAKGAVAALVRSVTDKSLGAPHTGALGYSGEQPRIPAAALSVEDASWLHRLQQAGTTPRVRLSLQATDAGMVTQHNVVADLPGRETPEEIVVLGCHLDSWDVGQGAQDDGSGCLIVWEAARLISLLPQPPRRTIRVVLYTAEETGIDGGKAYAAARSPEEIANHVALIESDTGNGRADGYRVDLQSEDPARQAALQAQLTRLGSDLGPIGLTSLTPGYSGADIRKVVALGPLGLGMNHDLTHYWEIHHTVADSFEKIDAADLGHNVGMMAATAWWLAEEYAP